MEGNPFATISTTSYADVLTRDRVMDFRLRGLWQPIPRIAGPAYPVFCSAGDGSMLQVALHEAPPGSVIVCATGDLHYAMAGGRGCAWAKQRGIEGLVIDGLIRDLAEVREIGFPVFGRGVTPMPGLGRGTGLANVPIPCGGVSVRPGDVVVADEEGIVVLPAEQADDLRRRAKERAEREETLTLDDWVRKSRARIDEMRSGAKA